jgi:plasmid stabilization system protein ParE
MKVEFLPSTELGLRWHGHYYENIFPEGRKKAKARFSATLRLLEANPFVGRVVEGFEAREISISGTPFLFVYRVVKSRIQILKLWDARGNPVDKMAGL